MNIFIRKIKFPAQKSFGNFAVCTMIHDNLQEYYYAINLLTLHAALIGPKDHKVDFLSMANEFAAQRNADCPYKKEHIMDAVNGHIESHIHHYNRSNNSKLDDHFVSEHSRADEIYMEIVERIMIQFNIKCTWPGLYPTYEFKSHEYYNISEVLKKIQIS